MTAPNALALAAKADLEWIAWHSDADNVRVMYIAEQISALRNEISDDIVQAILDNVCIVEGG